MDTQPETSAANTLIEDIHTAYRLIAEHYRCLKYPPESAPEFISALASSLECQVSESVLLIINAVAFHVGRGGHSKFIKQRMIIRAAEGRTLREVVWFGYGRLGIRDPRVTNRGVTLPATEGGE